MVKLSADARDLQSLSSRFRSRRDVPLRRFIEARRANVQGTFRILDLGGTADYWRRVGFDWLEAHDIDITCVNYEATEFGLSERESRRVRCIVGDATNMHQFEDNSFDFVHSNSVIEHVGRWPNMRDFANECRRLAPAYYVQTPYFWFPVDPHFYRVPFFHWMPESIRLKLLRRFKIGWSKPQQDVDRAMRMVMSNILLDHTQFGALYPDAKIRFERLMLLPKSLIAERGRP
jgi:hypothetical protein